MRFTPYAYQRRAVDFVIGHPFCGLFLDMGLGKSVITLTAVDTLLKDYLDGERVLVIAPKSVAINTWGAELAKWDHLGRLSLAVAVGTEAKRLRALEAGADITVINRENTQWLVDRFLDPATLRMRKPWPFDFVVVDESSAFKSHKTRRYRALYRMRPYIRRMVLLTGTPAPNGLLDLWAQIRLLDNGERLGKFLGQYREAYFTPGARNGAVVYDYRPKQGAGDLIAAKIFDICMSLKAEDYLEIPDIVEAGSELEFPMLSTYKAFERANLLALEDGTEIVAATAVALANKLLQFASGAVYDGEHEWHETSRAKVDALTDIVEAAGEPVLVYYNYRHELERILKEIPDAVPFKGEPEILERWNAGKVPVLLAHPASVAYGLNMQDGGRIIVWYSPTWNLELYQQANARLHRQGQTRPVLLYHLVCLGTMDEVVMRALRDKDNTQEALLRYIRAKANEIRT